MIDRGTVVQALQKPRPLFSWPITRNKISSLTMNPFIPYEAAATSKRHCIFISFPTNNDEIKPVVIFSLPGVRPLNSIVGSLTTLTFIPHSRDLCIGTDDGFLLIIDVNKLVSEYEMNPNTVPTGSSIVTRLLNIQGRQGATEKQNAVSNLATSTDYIIVGSSSGVILFYDSQLRLKAWLENLTYLDIHTIIPIPDIDERTIDLWNCSWRRGIEVVEERDTLMNKTRMKLLANTLGKNATLRELQRELFTTDPVVLSDIIGTTKIVDTSTYYETTETLSNGRVLTKGLPGYIKSQAKICDRVYIGCNRDSNSWVCEVLEDSFVQVPLEQGNIVTLESADDCLLISLTSGTICIMSSELIVLQFISKMDAIAELIKAESSYTKELTKKYQMTCKIEQLKTGASDPCSLMNALAHIQETEKTTFDLQNKIDLTNDVDKHTEHKSHACAVLSDGKIKLIQNSNLGWIEIGSAQPVTSSIADVVCAPEIDYESLSIKPVFASERLYNNELLRRNNKFRNNCNTILNKYNLKCVRQDNFSYKKERKINNELNKLKYNLFIYQINKLHKIYSESLEGVKTRNINKYSEIYKKNESNCNFMYKYLDYVIKKFNSLYNYEAKLSEKTKIFFRMLTLKILFKNITSSKTNKTYLLKSSRYNKNLQKRKCILLTTKSYNRKCNMFSISSKSNMDKKSIISFNKFNTCGVFASMAKQKSISKSSSFKDNIYVSENHIKTIADVCVYVLASDGGIIQISFIDSKGTEVRRANPYSNVPSVALKILPPKSHFHNIKSLKYQAVLIALDIQGKFSFWFPTKNEFQIKHIIQAPLISMDILSNSRITPITVFEFTSKTILLGFSNGSIVDLGPKLGFWSNHETFASSELKKKTKSLKYPQLKKARNTKFYTKKRNYNRTLKKVNLLGNISEQSENKFKKNFYKEKLYNHKRVFKDCINQFCFNKSAKFVPGYKFNRKFYNHEKIKNQSELIFCENKLSLVNHSTNINLESNINNEKYSLKMIGTRTILANSIQVGTSPVISIISIGDNIKVLLYGTTWITTIALDSTLPSNVEYMREEGDPSLSELHDVFDMTEIADNLNTDIRHRELKGICASNCVHSLMPPLGFYPTLGEEERLKALALDHGEDIDFETFIRLYFTHRPVLPESQKNIKNTLLSLITPKSTWTSNILTDNIVEPYLTGTELLSLLIQEGEVMTEKEVDDCFIQLTGKPLNRTGIYNTEEIYKKILQFN